MRMQRNFRLLGVLSQIPPRQLAGKAATRVKSGARRFLAPVSRSSLALTRLRATDRFSGLEAGNRFFWKSRLRRDWKSIASRLFQLDETGQPDLLNEFVRDALLYSVGAPIVMMLARSGLTKSLMAAHLRDPDLVEQLLSRFPPHPNFGTGLTAAAAFLLDDEEFAGFRDRLSNARFEPAKQHSELLDSFATVPTQRPTLLRGTVAEAPSRRPARHRLIIADALQDPTHLSLLFAGAEKISLFSPSNLFGRMTFSSETQLHARPAELIITHPRSRATRFSPAYHRLHDETRRLAEEIVDEIEREAGGWLDESKPYLAMHLADAMFFQGLRVVGLEELLADEDVDQVMVVSGETVEAGFFEFLADVQGLNDDPRVEFVSLARNERSRIRFAGQLAQAFSNSAQVKQTIPASVRPLRDLLKGLRADAAKAAQAMYLWPKAAEGDMAPRPKVLFATIPYTTYNDSSAVYANILSRHFDTMMGVVGLNAASLFAGAPELPIPPAGRVQLLPPLTTPDYPALNYSIQHLLERVAARHRQAGDCLITTRVIESRSAILAYHTIVSGLHHWERLLQWFDRMQAAGQRPDALIVSPLRPSLTGMTAAAARHFGVPSLAIEPHIINAEYCRYTRVMTDRYGTASGYLAKLAEAGFSVPAERIDIIGSPRLVATPPVPPENARKKLEKDSGTRFPPGQLTLAFFSQPSKWTQISDVWRIILAAMAPYEDLQILLKVHPEEGELRIAAYLAIAEEMGMAHRVQSVTAPPAPLIEASDLVLACYSATLVEAALAGRPAFSVSNADTRYPMDQHEVVGAPQFRDVASLSVALAEFRRDPTGAAVNTARFLEQNPQFVTGPEPGLVAAVDAMVGADPASQLRPADELPPRLFIEGPYRVYDI